MRVSAFLARIGVAAGFSALLITAAAAQATHVPGRGGGFDGGGGGGFHPEFETFDPCAFRDCYQRPPRRPPPRVIIEEGPYVYEEDLGPAKPRKPKKPKVEQAKPKKTTEPAGNPTASVDIRPDEVLVEFPLSTSQADIDALAQQQGIEQLGSQEISLLNIRLHRWRITNGRAPSSVAATLRNDSRVASANVNSVFKLQEGQNTGGPPQYAATKLKLDEVHAVTRGETAIVAVIDSGIDKTHPELEGAVASSFDAVGGDFQPHAHGTGMAGAIASQAMVKGVAPKARLLDVRAFAPTGKTQDGTTFDVVRGIDWASQNGARVLNLSFAGPRDALMARVIKAAIDKGIVVVAAAGNAGSSSPPLYPAAEAGVIAVTATDANDGILKVANRGGYVTLAAPGVDILLPAPNKAYAVSSGTSIATAYVSGIAALVVAKNPNADSKEVYEVLIGTARDLGAKGRDKEFGAGLVDPLAALQVMEPVPVTVSAPANEQPPVR